MTVVPLKGQAGCPPLAGAGRAEPEKRPPASRAMRGRIEESINSGSPECRPRTVPHHVGKPGHPTAARHRPTDPAHRRPEEEDRATDSDEGRAADDLRRARQPKPRRCHERRRDRNRGGGGRQGSRRNRCGVAGTACGAAAGSSSIVLRHLLRAVRQLIHLLRAVRQLIHELSAEVWPRHRTRQ